VVPTRLRRERGVLQGRADALSAPGGRPGAAGADRIVRLVATALSAVLALAGCASAPVNPPLAHVDAGAGYRYETRAKHQRDKEDVVILAFSGGGTRAASFSYGVLEALRATEVTGRDGRRSRVLDKVDVITGVSGGSFTALAYGLYGERLFDEYPRRFLERDVEGELIGRLLDPLYWPALSSPNWGRSELAADLYDEILFEGATFGDLQRKPGPMIVASATDLSSGARFYFTQKMFDILCSDLSAVRLSRAAAASSGVPVVLSPVLIYNYGGSCDYRDPAYIAGIEPAAKVLRPAARMLAQRNELRYFEDGSKRPYLHLVDGGVADNLGVREILVILEEMEALRLAGIPTPYDGMKRLVVFVVNSLSSPPLDWDAHREAPNSLEILLRATGVPIDHYSYEAVELLRDTAARWRMLRAIRDSGDLKSSGNPAFAEVTRVPDLELYVIDVSFAKLADAAERAYLNELPTSFVLPAEAVDRLRAAAATILRDSPDFQRYLRDIGAEVAGSPPAAGVQH